MGSPSGYELRPHVSRGGAIVRARASHQCDLFSSPSINFICGLSLSWFFPLLRQVFLQVLRFSPPTVPNSKSIWNAQRRLNLEFLRTTNFSWANKLDFTNFYTYGRRLLSPQHHPCLESSTCRTYDFVVILANSSEEYAL